MKKTMMLVLAMFLLAMTAGCGSIENATTDQTEPTPEETPPVNTPATDEAPYTSMSPADAAIPLGNTAVIFNSDWVVGNLSTIGLADPVTATLARITTDGSDAVVRSFGNRIYAVNRFGTDTIEVVDPADFSVVADFSVGGGSNPQDIVAVSDVKAYVSRLDAQNDAENSDDLLIVNPLTGERLGSIDLTPFTADDGERLARAAQMVLVEGRLYVCLQDLPANMLQSANVNGKVVVIDTVTDQVIDADPDAAGTQAIELAGRDPSAITYSTLTKKFYVADTGVYVNFVVNTADEFGGIEVFRKDGDRYVGEGIVVKDEDLGGGVSGVRLASAELGFTITNSTTVAAFNPSTSAIVDTNVYQTPGFYLPDVTIDQNGRLLVAEQDFNNPGVVFLSTDGTKIAGPTLVGAPPVSITFVDVP